MSIWKTGAEMDHLRHHRNLVNPASLLSFNKYRLSRAGYQALVVPGLQRRTWASLQGARGQHSRVEGNLVPAPQSVYAVISNASAPGDAVWDRTLLCTGFNPFGAQNSPRKTLTPFYRSSDWLRGAMEVVPTCCLPLGSR